MIHAALRRAPRSVSSAPAIDERGSFAHAAGPECTWTGPGRSARDRARRDQLRHGAEVHADGAGVQA